MNRKQKERRLHFQSDISYTSESVPDETYPSPVIHWDQINLKDERIAVLHRVSERNQRHGMQLVAQLLESKSKAKGSDCVTIKAIQESGKAKHKREKFKAFISEAKKKKAKYILVMSSSRLLRAGKYHLIDNSDAKPTKKEWDELLKQLDGLIPICIADPQLSNKEEIQYLRKLVKETNGAYKKNKSRKKKTKSVTRENEIRIKEAVMKMMKENMSSRQIANTLLDNLGIEIHFTNVARLVKKLMKRHKIEREKNK